MRFRFPFSHTALVSSVAQSLFFTLLEVSESVDDLSELQLPEQYPEATMRHYLRRYVYPIVVDLVPIGELPRGVQLERFMKLLHRQNHINFRPCPDTIDPNQFLEPACGFYFTEKEMLSCLKISSDAYMTIGITSIRISPMTESHDLENGCVFDFNPDNESIVSSVKAATLCGKCRQRIRNFQPQLEVAFQRILAGVERPPIRAVISYLQGNGIASVFLFSVLMGLSVGLLQSLLPAAEHIALVASLSCTVIFLGVIWYFHRYPSGDLK